MDEQKYVNSLSMEQLQNPRFADANNMYVKARMAKLDPIAAAIAAPNAQRDRLIAAKQYADARGGVAGEKRQVATDIAKGLPSSGFEQFMAAKKVPAMDKDTDYLVNTLGLNADNYDELLKRRAFDPNNAAVKRLVAGFAPKEVATDSLANTTLGTVDTAGVDPQSITGGLGVTSYEAGPEFVPRDLYEPKEIPARRKQNVNEMFMDMMNGNNGTEEYMSGFGA